MTNHMIWLWFPPFPVSYLSLPWGRSFCSVLVCQHNQWNVRSLAFLLILDCWRSSQSTVYVHDQTRVLKVPVLQLLFCVCCIYVICFIITAADTVTATITETFTWIVHNFQHCTVRTFSTITMHSWVNSWTKCTDWKHPGRIPAITEGMLIATPNERLNYSLPIYRRKWHMISLLTSSQQQKWSPCSSAREGDEENISNYLTQF